MEEDSLSDYDSVEEDVFSDPSPTEEAITGFEGLQLDSSGALQKEGSEHQDAGRCSSLDSGTPTVLEFSQDQSSKSVSCTILLYYNHSLRELLLRLVIKSYSIPLQVLMPFSKPVVLIS